MSGDESSGNIGRNLWFRIFTLRGFDSKFIYTDINFSTVLLNRLLALEMILGLAGVVLRIKIFRKSFEMTVGVCVYCTIPRRFKS